MNVYLHGTIAERLFGIMSEGRMRPSKINCKGGHQGVFAVDPDPNLATVVNYCPAVSIHNNGIYYHVVLELRSSKDVVKHNRTMYTDHVLDHKYTRILAFRFYAVHCREWRAGDGQYIRQAWDPYLEFRPRWPTMQLPATSSPTTRNPDLLQLI